MIFSRRPADRQIVLDFEQIEDSADNGIDKVIDCFGFIIETRRGRTYYSACIGNPEHIFQIDISQWHLTMDKDQWSPFFESNIRAAQQQRVSQPRGNCSDAVRRTGTNNHRVNFMRAAGYNAGQIVILVKGQLVRITTDQPPRCKFGNRQFVIKNLFGRGGDNNMHLTAVFFQQVK